MNKTTSFFITLVALIVARLADIASTNLFIEADMSNEANPTAPLFDSFGSMIFWNVVISVTVLVIPLIVFWRRDSKHLDEAPRTTPIQFASLNLFDRILDRQRFITAMCCGWPLPKSLIQSVRLVGFSLTWGVVAASFAAVLAWWATHSWGWDWYDSLRSATKIRGVPTLEIIFGIFGYAVASWRYFIAEHTRANRALNNKT